MPIRLDRIVLPFRRPESDLPGLAADRLGVSADRIASLRITHRSIDARQKPLVRFVYALEVTLDDPALEASLIAKLAPNPLQAPALPVPQPPPAVLQNSPSAVLPLKPLHRPPVIVGAGPAGLFAALLLAEQGYRPILIDRGRPVAERADDHARFLASRTPDPESNLLFGEGGAGTWSDGKLLTRIRSPWISYVLDALVAAGAPPDILIDAHPHVGTDLLHTVIPAIRNRIISLGGEVRFSCRLDELTRSDSAINLTTSTGPLVADLVILAPGSSARDTLAMLHRVGVALEPKPFQMGLRIEHPQPIIDRAQYGTAAGHPRLPAADYSLVYRGAVSIHTFCMCPGGVIVPTVSEPGRLCINGMSNSARDGAFANSALVWTERPASPDPLLAIQLQRTLEERAFALGGADYSAPAQRANDFIAHRPSRAPLETSYPLGARPAKLSQLLSAPNMKAMREALLSFGRRIKGFDGTNALLLAAETRASSPVRITRDETSRQSLSFPGLYPVGEGAGYAGGITSAAVDGLLSAQTIISTFAKP